MKRYLSFLPHLSLRFKRKHSTPSNLRILLVFLLISLAAPILYIILSQAKSTQAAWSNYDLPFRKKIPVTNNTTMETNVYISVTVSTTNALIANWRMQNDCGDLRFATANGQNLPYYIASGCNSASTVVHVLLSSFPAGAQDIYYYYGNLTVPDGFSAGDFATEASNYAVGTIGSEESSQAAVLYYKFDEGQGKTVYDSTNFKNDGVFGDGTTASLFPSWQPAESCKSGTCLKFDGVNDSIKKEYANDTELDPYASSFTVSAWFKHSSTVPSAGTVDVLLTRYEYAGYRIYMGIAGQMCFGIEDEGSWYSVKTTSPDDEVCSPTSYADSTWHFLEAVKNGTSSITLYIDGVQVATDGSLLSGSLMYNDGEDNFYAGLYIGSDVFNYQTQTFWEGYIDSLKIYNYAKTAAQVKTDYKTIDSTNSVQAVLGSPPNDFLSSGLVGYWKMNETSDNAYDSSGNNITLQNPSSAPFTDGKFGNASSLSAASSQYFSTPSNSILSITGDLTLSTWIKPASNTAATLYDIMGKWDTSNTSYLFAQYGSELRLYLNSAANYVTSTNANLNTGTWYHVAATYTASTREVKLYLNGVALNITTTGTIPSSITSNSAAFYIGADGSASPYLYTFQNGSYHFISDILGGITSSEEENETFADITNKIDVVDHKVKIRITEELAETTYLNRVYLRVDGHEIISPEAVTGTNSSLDLAVLLSGDEQYLILKQGDEYFIEFPAPDTFTQLEFVAQGYYVPQKTDTVSPEPFQGLTNTSWVKDFIALHPDYAVLPVVKRDLNSIHFQKPNGQIEAEISQNPIHYLDEKNAWQPIDTALTKSTDPEYDYMNVTNGAKSYFSVRPARGKPNVKFQKNDSWMAFSTMDELKLTLPDTSQTNRSNLNDSNDIPLARITENHQNQILYPQLYSNGDNTVDVQYTITEDRLKEEVILNRYMGIPDISQTVHLHNVYARSEGKLVKFYSRDTNTMLWYIEPTMYEQQNPEKGSNGIHFELKCEDGSEVLNECRSIILTKVIEPAGQQWLTDPQRTYPVVIDPATIPVDSYDGEIRAGGNLIGASTWAAARNGSNSFTTTGFNRMRVGSTYEYDWDYEQDSYYNYRSYLKFDTSSIGSGASVTQVNLKMAFYNLYAQAFDIQIAKHDWSAQDPIAVGNREAAYDNCLSAAADDNIFRSTSGASTNTQYTSGDLSTAWINKTGNTFYCLRASNDYDNVAPTGFWAATLYSSEETTESYRPILSVSYSIPLYNYFNGSIDEARIYNRTLSPIEIEQLYNWAPGPVGYWKLDENTGIGSTAYDTSSNSNNLTLTNGPTFTPGKYGNALSFAGSNQHLIRADDSDFDFAAGNSFTLETWFKHNTASATQVIMSKFNEAGYKLLMESDGDITCGIDYDNTWSPTDSVTSTAASYDDNTWHHVACVKDSNTSLTLYIDGVSVGTPDTTLTNSTLANSDPLYIGIDADGTSNDWVGQLDDIRIYPFARTAKQVVEDLNAGHPIGGSPVSSSIGFWKFNEGADNTCPGGTNDVCNSGSQGTALDGTSTASRTTAGKFDKALDFNGSDDVVTVTNTSAVDLNEGLASGFSLSSWFNADSDGEGDNGHVFWKGDNTYIKVSGESGGSVNIQASVDLDTTDATLTLTAPVTTSSWNHVVLVWADDADDELTLYINGVNKGSSTNGVGSPAADTNNLLIGNNGAGTNTFDGKIDEVRLFNLALSDDEVGIVYNQNSSLVLGSASTAATGREASSTRAAYCPPGNTEGNCAAGSDPSPIGEWNMEEKVQGDSKLVHDTSGSGYNGTTHWGANTSGMDCSQSGKIGAACSFDGVDDYISTSTPETYAAGEMSVFAWVKFRDVSTGQPIITSLNSADQWAWGLSVGSNKVSSGWGEVFSDSSNTRVQTNQWYYVGFTRSGSSGNWTSKIYINGKLDKTTTSIAEDPYTSVSTDVEIGRNGDALDGFNFFNGLIDDVKVYNYTRTPAQIAWDYNKGKPVAQWKFDECSGTTLHDAASNTYNGTISIGASGEDTVGTCETSSTAWGSGASGKFNYSLSFDGSDDKATIGVGISAVQSVSFWVKPTTTTDSFMDLDGGTHYITASSGTVSATGFASPTIYVNGVANGTVTAGTWNHIVVTTATAFNSSTSFTLGYKSAASADYLAGQLDDVQVFNYVLTPTQVNLLYNSGGIRF